MTAAHADLSPGASPVSGEGGSLDAWVVLAACLAYGLFFWSGLPVHAVADEIPILKAAYEALSSGSPRLQSPSAYSAWTHLVHLPGVALYWLGWAAAHGFPPLAEVKRAVLTEYQMALLAMRALNGLFFVFSLWLAKRVGDETIGRPYGLWLFLLLAGNVLVLAQAHTVKHWIPGHALALCAIFLAHRAYRRGSGLRAMAAYFVMALSVLLLPVTVFFLPFFLLLFIHHGRGGLRLFLIHLGLFAACVGAAWLLTVHLGAGANVSDGVSGRYRLLFDSGKMVRYAVASAYIHPLQAAALLWSLATLGAEPLWRRIAWALLLASALAGLAFLSGIGVYANYYGMLLHMLTAPLAALAPARLLLSSPRSHARIMALALALSALAVGSWCSIAARDDTRQQAAAWVQENAASAGDFTVYDTATVSYLAATPTAVRLLAEHYPDTLSFRERAVLEYGLAGQANGMHLWKVTLAGHDAGAFLDLLLARGFRVVLAHERFGLECNVQVKHPGMIERLRREFTLEEAAVFRPFAAPDADMTRLGDILHDFRSTAYNLWTLERPGPVVTLHEVRGRRTAPAALDRGGVDKPGPLGH